MVGAPSSSYLVQLSPDFRELGFSEVQQIRRYQLRKGMLVVFISRSLRSNPAAIASDLTEAAERLGCGVGPTTISRIESNLASLPIGIL